MAVPRLESIVSYLRSVAPAAAGASEDGQLLARFGAGDQSAFAALLARYAGLVWGVCRRALPQTADAEDAFQATWIVLTRRAPSLGGGPLGPWLHAVASRTAAKARAVARRRAGRETAAAAEPATNDPPFDDLAGLLDEEIGRLPEKYRRVVILCCLEGLTNAQAAERLGCPLGTVLSRLSRARELLRQRLARRGLELPAASAPLAAPAELLRASLAGAAGGAGAAASATVLSLAEGAIPNVSLHKSKLFALTLLAATFAGGAGLWAYSANGASPKTQRAALAAGGDAKADEKQPDAKDKKPDARDEEKAPRTGADASEALNRTIDFSGFDDPKMTLAEALETLGKRYNLQFDVNETAFTEDQLKDVRNAPISEVHPLPPLKASLRTVLTKVLARVPVSSGATFVIRKDHVEITTDDAVRRELGLPTRKRDENDRRLEPMVLLVWQEFRKEPLDAALRRIAEELDVNVVLDARVEEKATAKVTAALHNVSVETALKLLTNQADLVVVKVENVFYVTSPENAAKLKK